MSSVGDLEDLINAFKGFEGLSPGTVNVRSNFYCGLEDIDPENTVVDLNVWANLILGQDVEGGFHAGDFIDYLEDYIGREEISTQWSPLDNSFQIEETPEQDLEALKKLSENGVTLYYPNHLEGFLKSKIRDIADRNGSSLEELKPYKEILVQGVEQACEELDVEGEMELPEGISYCESVMRELCDGVEDQYLLLAAEELPGETVIATYDGDFIDEDIPAYPPRLLYQLVKHE